MNSGRANRSACSCRSGFRAAQTPAGLVLHHGDFPGIAIIGADQSLLHQPALQRLAVDSPH